MTMLPWKRPPILLCILACEFDWLTLTAQLTPPGHPGLPLVHPSRPRHASRPCTHQTHRSTFWASRIHASHCQGQREQPSGQRPTTPMTPRWGSSVAPALTTSTSAKGSALGSRPANRCLTPPGASSPARPICIEGAVPAYPAFLASHPKLVTSTRVLFHSLFVPACFRVCASLIEACTLLLPLVGLLSLKKSSRAIIHTDLSLIHI